MRYIKIRFVTGIILLSFIAWWILIANGCKKNKNVVYQTIKRTCYDHPDCYYALYTIVYYKGAKVKEWVDDAEYLTPVNMKARKAEGDSLIRLFDKLELKYENLLK